MRRRSFLGLLGSAPLLSLPILRGDSPIGELVPGVYYFVGNGYYIRKYLEAFVGDFQRFSIEDRIVESTGMEAVVIQVPSSPFMLRGSEVWFPSFRQERVIQLSQWARRTNKVLIFERIVPGLSNSNLDLQDWNKGPRILNYVSDVSVIFSEEGKALITKSRRDNSQGTYLVLA